ncbi:MAG: sulfite exporter TauE/SafE family protein [Burkholderiales bacterium]
MEWWAWPIVLFAITFAMGIVAVLAGVGGGVLFVPIMAAFFPFHLDFVRAGGLLLALTTALSAAPSLLRSGLASVRLAMPLALVSSVTSIAGATLGLALPTGALQAALGVAILAIVVLMWRSRGSEQPSLPRADPLGHALGMHGVYHDPALGRDIAWQVQRTPAGLAVFAVIGVVAGMFGLGAGWANVPALNLLMGVPLKLAVGTSGFLLIAGASTASWVYLQRGAVLPMLIVPSIIGAILGAKVGVRVLRAAKPALIRRVVLVLLFLAGGRALLRGFGV